MSQQKKTLEIPIHSEDENKLPVYSSKGASGADVRAHIPQELPLHPGESALVPTGLRLAIPEGYEIQVRPRSGLALKHQISILNTPGTIDSDYRGEIGIILINHGKEVFTIRPGMRIAQLVVAPVIQATFLPAKTLEETPRGKGGFGHTGFH